MMTAQLYTGLPSTEKKKFLDTITTDGKKAERILQTVCDYFKADVDDVKSPGSRSLPT